MNQFLKYKTKWLTRILLILTGFFVFQNSIATVSANMVNIGVNTKNFSGFWGGVDYYIFGGTRDGFRYNRNGEVLGVAPTMGVVNFGKGGLSLIKGVKSLWQSIRNIGNVTKTLGRGARTSKTLYNFGSTAGKHFANPARKVPLQIMDDVIKNTKGLADPRGSRALMHYSRMTKNGKLYNLEVLYDKATNSIWHFKYDTRALGPLQAIPK